MNRAVQTGLYTVILVFCFWLNACGPEISTTPYQQWEPEKKYAHIYRAWNLGCYKDKITDKEKCWVQRTFNYPISRSVRVEYIPFPSPSDRLMLRISFGGTWEYNPCRVRIDDGPVIATDEGDTAFSGEKAQVLLEEMLKGKEGRAEVWNWSSTYYTSGATPTTYRFTLEGFAEAYQKLKDKMGLTNN